MQICYLKHLGTEKGIVKSSLLKIKPTLLVHYNNVDENSIYLRDHNVDIQNQIKLPNSP